MSRQYHDDDLLTRGEVADLARVNANTVTSWARTGKLPVTCRTIGGRHRRYRWADVRDVLTARRPLSVRDAMRAAREAVGADGQ